MGLAHPALETRINDLTQAITQVPDSAELYLRGRMRATAMPIWQERITKPLG